VKCKSCGRETIGRMSHCYKCLEGYSDMKQECWNFCEAKFGEMTPQNLNQWQVETKRLVAIWRKSPVKFREEIEKEAAHES
jgi:hypothetical protein